MVASACGAREGSQGRERVNVTRRERRKRDCGEGGVHGLKQNPCNFSFLFFFYCDQLP